MKDVIYCNDLFKYYSLVHIRTLLGTLFWSPSAGRQGFRLFGMVHDAMPSRGKVQQIQLRPITAAACRRAQFWAGRRFQGVTFNAPKVGLVILKAAALIFQLRAIIGLCPHNAGASRKQCSEHSQRHQIWFGWHSAQSWAQCPGGCILRRSFCRAEVGPPLSPEEWKGGNGFTPLASCHGPTLLNVRAAP